MSMVLPLSDPPRQSTETEPQSRMSESDAEELRKIDAAFERIFNTVPEYPYILSAPSAEPRYHYPSRQEAESWAKNTPFKLNEEHLQYMTYIYREPAESCFVMRSHIDEERDRLAYTKKVNGITSRPTTPSQNAAAKRKITLSAYKDKLASGSSAQKGQSPTKVEPAEVKKLDGIQAVKSRGLTHPATMSSKGPSTNNKAMASSIRNPPTSPPHPAPALKPSPLLEPNGAPHDLPPLLSPTNPFEAPKNAKDPSIPWDLPPMLSPTLPPKIEAALAEEEKRRSRANSNTSTSSVDRAGNPHVTASDSISKPRPIDHSEGAKMKEGVKEAPRAASNTPSNSAGARKVSDEHKSSKTDAAPPKASKLIVRLKYGTTNRKRVDRMLRLPPRPNRDLPKPKQTADIENSDGRPGASSSASQPAERHSKDAPIKEVNKKDHLPQNAAKGTTRTPEKRPRTEDHEPAPSAKRQKLPSSLELEKRPKTPNQSAVHSPSIHKSGGSVKSSAVLTPRGDQLKPIATVRSTSNDTPVSTPGGKRSHLTPLAGSSKGGDGKGPKSAPATGIRSAEISSLNQFSQHYNKLGRGLKHENEAIYAKAKEQLTDPERKRGALLAMECILAYMLAYALTDSRRKLEGRGGGIESTWRTLLPLFRHMRGFVGKYKHLDGLHNYLGIAINARISTVALERINRASNAPIAADSPQSANTETAAAQDSKIASDSFKSLTDCAREAATKLPIEDIMSYFPATWATRATGARDAVWEALITSSGEKSLNGKYYLPISVDTTPIQAVRFGVNLIKEWVQREELGYEPRIRLT